MGIIIAYSTLCIVWGTTYLVIRVALEGFDPYFMGGMRFLVAGTFLLPALLRKEARLPKSLREWGIISLCGLLMLTGANGLVNFSEVYISSGLTALTVSTSPMWSALIGGWLFSRDERFDKWSAVGCALAMSGILVLHHDRLDMSHAEWPGMIAALCAPVLWALGSLIARNYVKRVDAITSTTLQMFASTAGFFLISFLIGESWHPDLTPRVVWSMVYLIAVGSCFVYVAFVWLLKHLPASRVSTYAYINPLIALVAGHLILNEPITWEIYPATLLILGGLLLIYFMHNLNRAKSAAPAKT